MSQGDKCWYISNRLDGVVLEDGSLHFQISSQISYSFFQLFYDSACIVVVILIFLPATQLPLHQLALFFRNINRKDVNFGAGLHLILHWLCFQT
jgi:uncharacterized membrane protein